MVQVGCTINYGRSALWKQTKEFSQSSSARISVLLCALRSTAYPAAFLCALRGRSPRTQRLEALDPPFRSQINPLLSRQKQPPPTNSAALTIGARSARILEVVRNGQLVVVWACGAAGSALPWHGRGRRFDPDQVHHIFNYLQIPRFSVW